MKDNEKITENEIEKYNSSFISEELKNSESDVVYKMKNENVFFLIEHQTKIDYSMPYRILKYELNLIESVENDNKYIGKWHEYSLVIPIVLYTKEERKFLNKATSVLALNIVGEKKAKEILKNIDIGGEGDMLAVFDMIREENERIFNDGRKAGIETGIKTGSKSRNLEIIKNMLKEKLPLELIAKITGVSEKEINKMK